MSDNENKRKVNAIVRDVKLKEKTGVSMYEKPLTPQQVLELKEWKDYKDYDSLLEERNNLILEIENRKETLKNLNNNIEEYRGGLGNYRAKSLNLSFATLSRLFDNFLGFMSASIIYNGLKVWRTPSLWIYFGAFAFISFIISLFEMQRYKALKRRL